MSKNNCSIKMSQVVILVLFVFPLSLVHADVISPGSEAFWKGLKQFQEAAEKQLADKPIPDLGHWKSQRRETINTLKALKDKLDNVCFYANCGKAAGSGMGIACSLSAFLTFLTNLFGMSFLTPVVSAGLGFCPAGYFTREMSSILESVVSKNYQMDLQSVLIKDKEHSSSLNKWFEYSQNLEDEIQKIFGSKAFMLIDYLRDFYNLHDLLKESKETLDLMKRGKFFSFLDEDIGIDELRQFIQRIKDSPQVLNKIRLSLAILSYLTNISPTGFEIYRKLRDEMVTTAISFVWKKLNIKTSPNVKVPAFLLVNALDLTIHITSFKDATKIVIYGKCPYSDSLKHIIDLLELELKTIEIRIKNHSN